MINHLYRKITTIVQAKQTTQEFLADSLFRQSNLLSKRMDLYELERLFNRYIISGKGLKTSMLSMNELSNLISSDIRHTQESLEEINHYVLGTKELLASMTSEYKKEPIEQMTSRDN